MLSLSFMPLLGIMAQETSETDAQVKYGMDCETAYNYTAAIKAYESAAKAGSSKALVRIGDMYLHGRGMDADVKKAVKMYQKAASKDDKDAILLLAGMYEKGEGVKQSASEAEKWYRRAAELGSGDAVRVLESRFSRGEDEKERQESEHWIRKAAEQGDARASLMLGERSESADMTEAVRWYEMSASHGGVVARERLGEIYYKGRGVEQNYDKAGQYFSQVAEAVPSDSAESACVDKAIVYLGTMCITGNGQGINLNRAAELLGKVKDNAVAAHNLAIVQYKLGELMYGAQDFTAAIALLSSAANSAVNPVPAAMSRLSVCYKYGMGAPVDKDREMFWDNLSKQTDNPDALKAKEPE